MKRLLLITALILLLTSCESEEMVMGTENAPAKLLCLKWDTNGIDGYVHYQVYKGNGGYYEASSTERFLTFIVERGDYILVQVSNKGLDQANGQIYCKLKAYSDDTVYYDGNDTVSGMGASFLIR